MQSDAEIIKELEKKVAFLTTKVENYENGDEALFYAVQRKMKELSKILNKHDLGDVDIDDKNSKTFERLSAILEKCEKYAMSANALGGRLGVSNPDDASPSSVGGVVRKITTPESMADNIGELAGKKN